MSRNVTIVFPPALRPEDWAAAHDRGDAPGAAPYGLDLLTAQGIELEYDTARPAGRNPLTWAGLRRAPQRRRPDPDVDRAAIAWDESMAVPLLGRYGGSGRKLAAGVIWATDGRTTVRGRLLHPVLRQMDLVWCLSRGQLPLLRSWLDVDRTRVAYLPFGIDTDFFAASPWPARPMVLSLGNDQDRDVPTLLGALQRIHQARPDVRLVVQTRSPSPAPPGVEILSSVSTKELLALYAEATVVLVATRPNLHVSGMTVSLEAMATGRPVVLSRTAGASDYVLDGTTGRLAVPGDADSHAAAVLALLDEPELARGLGRSAREHVVTRHDQAVMCRHLAALIFDDV